mmetsp:Transcript_48114/g.126618  ORF Transcript_48114/g.126618 Transcript_48114/m.126618 type:complete len:261 (-) Transcript_48114:50-832(-)
MQHEHRHALRLELLCEQHRADVARRAAHVVAVVAALGVLREAPLGGARLRGDDDDGSADQARLLQRRRDAQRADGADVDLLELLVKVDVGERLLLLPEVTCVVDHVVERLGDFGDHLAADGGRVGHVHARDHLHARQRVQVRAALAADDDHVGTLRVQLLDNRQAKPLVAAGHEHTLALQVAAVEDRIDVKVASILLLLRLFKACHLVCLGEARSGHHLSIRKGRCGVRTRPPRRLTDGPRVQDEGRGARREAQRAQCSR